MSRSLSQTTKSYVYIEVLTNVSSHEYTTFSVSIHPSMDFWVPSTPRLLWTMLLWNMVCKYITAYLYSEWNVPGEGEMSMMPENRQKIARPNPLRTPESKWRSWLDRNGDRGGWKTREQIHGGGWYIWWKAGEEIPVGMLLISQWS